MSSRETTGYHRGACERERKDADVGSLVPGTKGAQEQNTLRPYSFIYDMHTYFTDHIVV